MADAIQLMLSMYERTDEQKYLDQADRYGKISVNQFLTGLDENDSPLPTILNDQDFYEVITGGDDLMLQLHRLEQACSGAVSP